MSSGSLTVIGGAGLVIGSFVSGGTATPNFTRFAKSEYLDYKRHALYTAGLELANIFHQKKKPMVLISGIIGTILSVWLYYNFCNWLNVLNWGISSINGMVVAVVCYLIGYFVKKNQR